MTSLQRRPGWGRWGWALEIVICGCNTILPQEQTWSRFYFLYQNNLGSSSKYTNYSPSKSGWVVLHMSAFRLRDVILSVKDEERISF